MASWFTVERVTQFLRIVFALIGIFTGTQAYQGNAVLEARAGGVAAASTEDKLPVNANMIISGLSVFLAAYRKPIESALKWAGVPDGTTELVGDFIDAGRLNQLRTSFRLAKSPEERDAIRKAARIASDENFNRDFPPEKTEAAK